MPILDNVLGAFGNTPLVRLQRVTDGVDISLYAKLEYMNPLASVKDRIGVAMVDAAMRDGKVGPETVLIEATSGNTGIALAFASAVRGLRLKLVMPDDYSVERRSILLALGVELELTRGNLGMQGAVDRANELGEALSDAFIVRQFENPANPEIHERTTALEILRDTGGEVDMLVTGVGTGGTFTGVTRVLKREIPGFMGFAVEPDRCAVISGGPPGPHGLQGLGAGFIPPNLDLDLVDGVVRVTDEEAYAMSRRLAAEEGIFCGISSGANVAAALKVASQPTLRGKRIVTFCCSAGERYLSTPLFADLGVGK